MQIDVMLDAIISFHLMSMRQGTYEYVFVELERKRIPQQSPRESRIRSSYLEAVPWQVFIVT